MKERREAGERDACREAVERVASRMRGMAAERSSCCAFKTLGTRHRKHKTDRFLSADSRQSIPNFQLVLIQCSERNWTTEENVFFCANQLRRV